MPIVDDPFQFGRIAATNAIADLYAMGAQPLFALAILGMPINVLPLDVIQQITAGGESVCVEAGIVIAGGHSIDSVEPIYGLVAIGIVDPKDVKRNNRAREGDIIILSKPIGVGILSAALKKEQLSDNGYQEMIALTTKLNKPGVALSKLSDVHALTDVTGFGLAGHLLEMTRGSQLKAEINWEQIPLIPEAVNLVQSGVFTGESTRNWASYGDEVHLVSDSTWQKQLLTDPQTSGGFLISCAPDTEELVLKILHDDGFMQAQKIEIFVTGSGLSVK
jgi:selenide,water dikinase